MMKNKKACFTSNTDNWKTPSDLYDIFINCLGCYDPCPYLCVCDNLYKDIKYNKIFINPRFSDNKNWFKYVKSLYDLGKKIFLLVPVRSDTTYFYDLMTKTNWYLYFIKGRLHFNDGKSAPFPSCLIILDRHYCQNSTYFVDYDELKWILKTYFC